MGVDEKLRVIEGIGLGMGVENDTGVRMDGMRNLRSIETAMVVVAVYRANHSRFVARILEALIRSRVNVDNFIWNLIRFLSITSLDSNIQL